MKLFSGLFATAIVVTCYCSVPAVAAPIQLLSNGNFATGNLTDWNAFSVAPAGSVSASECCETSDPSGTVVATSGDFSSPLSGTNAAWGNIDGGGIGNNNQPIYNGATNIWLNQTFTKSGQYSSAILTFAFEVDGGQCESCYVSNPGYGGTIDPRQVVVNIGAGGDYTTASGATTVYTYDVPDLETPQPQAEQFVSVDISAILNSLPDGTVTLALDRFVPQYFTAGAYFVADDFSILATPEATPTPGALSIVALGLLGAGVMRRKAKAV